MIRTMMMNESATSTAERLRDAVLAVTKDWAKQRRAEERHDSAVLRRHERLIRSRRIDLTVVVAEVMADAYMAASANDTLPANARQIMYAVRRLIQGKTDKYLTSRYFTQSCCPIISPSIKKSTGMLSMTIAGTSSSRIPDA